MENLDRMMECLGLNDGSIKKFVSFIPFESQKSNIMRRINKANEPITYIEWFYPLIFVLAIAFSVLVIRCVIVPVGQNMFLVSIFTRMVIDYSNQLLEWFKALSFIFSVLICTGIYFLISHLENEQRFW